MFPARNTRDYSTVNHPKVMPGSSCPQSTQDPTSYSTSMSANTMPSTSAGDDFNFSEFLHSDAMTDNDAGWNFQTSAADTANHIPATSNELNFGFTNPAPANSRRINPADYGLTGSVSVFDVRPLQHNTTQLPTNMPSSSHARRILPSPPHPSSQDSNKSSQCNDNTQAMQAEITRLKTLVSGLQEENASIKNQNVQLKHNMQKVETISQQLHRHSSKQRDTIAKLEHMAAHWEHHAINWKNDATKAIYVADQSLKRMRQQQVRPLRPQQPRQQQPVVASQPAPRAQTASPPQTQPSVASSSQSQPIVIPDSPAPEQQKSSSSSPVQAPRSRTKQPDWLVSQGGAGLDQAMHPLGVRERLEEERRREEEEWNRREKELEAVKTVVKPADTLKRKASSPLSDEAATQPAKKKQKKSKQQKKEERERAEEGEKEREAEAAAETKRAAKEKAAKDARKVAAKGMGLGEILQRQRAEVLAKQRADEEKRKAKAEAEALEAELAAALESELMEQEALESSAASAQSMEEDSEEESEEE